MGKRRIGFESDREKKDRAKLSYVTLCWSESTPNKSFYEFHASPFNRELDEDNISP